MNAGMLQHQLSQADDRTRKAVAGSLILHVVLLSLLALLKPLSIDEAGLVEITWLEASALPEPAAPAPAATLPLPRTETPTPPQPRDQKKFERTEQTAQVQPRPQTPDAMDDRLNEQLAALRNAPVTPQPNALPIEAPVSTWSSKTVSDVPAPVAANPTNLVRERTRSSQPAQLRRDTSPRPTRLASVAPNPTALLNPKAAQIDESQVRSLKGAQLVGPVADRPLLEHAMPVYPEWAKADAIEASVTLQFRVLPDGRVKESILVEKTSGYGEFDRNAMQALAAWRFEPMPAGNTDEQWGKITFHFRLRNRG